ncbi:PilZ domain-containing protein [Chthonobacter albigriseus]|uniref:PilZ domain-containing protein n=1 Tax=Chthonobacter albigriseus TaxID=1683161 RepID=UPI0015EE59A0|nr:PilZ domain-containing protein [Chthonobacter albigriseus]
MSESYEGPESRSAKRIPCQLRAIAYAKGKPLTCTITDISVLGCRLRLPSSESAAYLQQSILVDVVDCELLVYGDVVWRRNRDVGVRFDLKRKVHSSKAAIRSKRGAV